MKTSVFVYEAVLQALGESDRLRRCRVVEPETWPQCRVDGKPAIDFCNNNTLGLAQDPRLKIAAQKALEVYGTGSGASRLVSGTNCLVQDLEDAVAVFKQTEAALVFNSGYQANVGIFQALVGLDSRVEDWIFMDKLNHASLVDGVLLSKARWTRYRHGDPAHLETRLKKAPANARKWIVTDTIFSMDGDQADLPELVALAERYNACLMVDEAHATGVFGKTRRSGLVEQLEPLGLSDRVTLQMGTFSKALGGAGAYVAGSRVLIETLINRCRSFIYSTAPPPPVVAAAREAVRMVQHEPEPCERLWQNIRAFHAGLTPILEDKGLSGLRGSSLAHPVSQIVPIILGTRALGVSDALLEEGIYVQAIRPPTVPEGTERLRITLSAAHTEEQLSGLLEALSRVL